jgi:TetR/AcrR family transcriptional regulator
MADIEINTETLILNAAKKVFSHKGFDGTSMQEIANEAGINKSLVHYYFRSKEKLFDAVFDEVLMLIIPKISETMASDIPFFNKIEIFTETYITVLQNNPHIPIFVLHELNCNPDKIIMRFNNHLEQIEQIFSRIKEEISSNVVGDIPANQFIVNLFSLCIFPIIAKPILKGILFKNDEKKYLKFIEKRKKEIPKFIINSIKR